MSPIALVTRFTPTGLSLALSLGLVAAAAGAASAQQLELPRPSPNAKLTQTVGLTDITVEYSSPGVKGRKIWGEVVPYDQVWRTGANSATKVSFSKDVTAGDKLVPAGSYSLFTIPGKASWTVILNKNASASTREYDQKLDILRYNTTAKTVPHRERLAFLVEDFDEKGASLDVEWDTVRVSLPIKLSTDAQAAANIKAMTEGSWRPYNAAARYLLEQKKDYDGAMALVDKSLSLHEDWLNVWTKAQLIAAKGNHKAALPLAQRANEMGQKAEFFFAADDVKKALTDWKK